MNIDINELKEEDKNRLVVYKNYRLERTEEGVITSWNDTYIFVRYGGDNHSKATSPRDLDWSIK